MGENSKIEWTDHTFNPWIGCTKVAPGCEHCYAEALATRWGKATWGPQGTRVRTSPANWAKPLAWDRAARNAGVRARVFCASLADVFEQWNGWVLDHQGNVIADCRSCGHTGAVGGKNDAGNACTRCGSGAITIGSLRGIRRELFALIDRTPNLDWLLLTKRPQNVLSMWPMIPGASDFGYEEEASTTSVYRSNVWIGTSLSDQPTADTNLNRLSELRYLVPVMFASAEPLLGPVILPLDPHFHFLDWVIGGGESGPGARPMHPDWARSLRDQCVAAGVPFFFKQWGEWLPDPLEDWSENQAIDIDGETMYRHGFLARKWEPRRMRLLDGRTWDEFPAAAAATVG